MKVIASDVSANYYGSKMAPGVIYFGYYWIS